MSQRPFFTAKEARSLVRRLSQQRQIRGAGAQACWLWTGPVISPGLADEYGVISVRGRSFAVHRASYMLFVGPLIRAHYVVDHLCRSTRCFRPGHLQQVTQSVNALRANRRARSRQGDSAATQALLDEGILNGFDPTTIHIELDLAHVLTKECGFMKAEWPWPKNARGPAAPTIVRHESGIFLVAPNGTPNQFIVECKLCDVTLVATEAWPDLIIQYHARHHHPFATRGLKS